MSQTTYGTVSPTQADVAPSGPLALLLRALIAVGLVAGWVQLAHTPVQRPIEELVRDLETGHVTSMTIERPPPDSQGAFAVEWDGPGRPSYSSYLHNTDAVRVPWDHSGVDELADPDSAARIDERAEIISLAERAGVEVIERDWAPSTGGIRWELGGIAWLAGLFLLIAGPQPRLATRWAWFWLALHAPPMMLALVVLEPTPWGRRLPIPPTARRLTGGWALLLSLLLASLLTAVPWYSELFPR